MSATAVVSLTRVSTVRELLHTVRNSSQLHSKAILQIYTLPHAIVRSLNIIVCDELSAYSSETTTMRSRRQLSSANSIQYWQTIKLRAVLQYQKADP